MAEGGDRRSQLLKGALDTCLLALLSQRPTHAYDLVVQLQQRGLTGVSYGTVYPLVGRLRRQGLLDERIEPSPSGPARKVFEVSLDGHRALRDWTQQWLQTTTTITELLTTTGALRTDQPPEVSADVTS